MAYKTKISLLRFFPSGKFPLRLSAMGKEKQGSLSDRLLSLRHHLHESLSLGLKYNSGQEAKWVCIDAGMESHTLKRIDGFLDYLSLSLSQHPLIKESISKIIPALTGILKSHNVASQNYATEVTSKLVSIIQNNIRDYPTLEMIASLCHLLLLDRFACTTKSSCVIALSTILKKMSSVIGENHRKIKNILEANSIVGCISHLLNDEMEGFTETVVLLRTIVLGWPEMRYRVWKDNNLMKILEDNCDNSNISISTNVLKVLSSLALCSHGAKHLLENEALFRKIIRCMGKSSAVGVRIESLILFRHLRFGELISTVRNTNYETIVEAMTDAMAISNGEPLILEACRTMSVLTRGAGPHHLQLWVCNIDRISADIILRRFTYNQNLLGNKEILEVHQHVWDILSFLVAYLPQQFRPKSTGLDDLISSACSWALTVVGRRSRSMSSDILYLDEAVCRALLLMLLSPCNYVSQTSRSILSAQFEPYYDSISQLVERVFASLHSTSTGAVPTSQAISDLTILGCLATFPQYQTLILKWKGLNIFLDVIKGRLDGDILVDREKVMPHLRKLYTGKTCCSELVNDWEGADLSLFYALICLSQLIDASNYSIQDSTNSLFWRILRDDHIGEGPKSYCAYILSLFGIYGFPSNFGTKIGELSDMKVLADIRFLLSAGYTLDVHGAILAARCPKLVPPNIEAVSDKMTIVKMSERVDKEALGKILGYVYTGFTELNDLDEGCFKKVKVLANNCSLESLSQMLNKEWPKWGSCGPHFNLAGALGLDGHPFLDVILEAKSSKQMSCKYSSCHLSTPHVHAHKIILCANCEYLRGLFSSGMHDSFSNLIKVPIDYEALIKLNKHFYHGKMPQVNPDCYWKSLTREEQISELIAYTELSSLAEYWFLEGVAEDCLSSMVPLLSYGNTDIEVIIEVVRFAYNLGQYRVVEMCVKNLAPIYPKLRYSGYIAETGDDVAEILRIEHVRLLENHSPNLQ
ncbi:hypothetical protein LUZ62_081670 [Rhynchospora pubera]|uniref:BTB domain-containing protein n=1 Tax=Rhynchospora pubera TaxID=906938 RepID=A0AAV8BVT7_9POAL|nr:hypothetical protein LUZ62_081670 [Rhynchospora pubera]